ncbi:MAG: sulfite exporter TauE/SafE family protein [Actinomycetota bacterium]|nr:sulfite exporter TauE/SafE family protein [Actinomycetota bacterium]
MDAGIFRDALTALAGIATGIMSGTFGVGGAVISTPAIRALGCSAALAVGTTLPSILPGAVSGSWRYRQGELIQWKVVAFTAPSGIVAAILGAWVSPRVPGDGHILMVLTALLLMWSSISMIRSVSPREPRELRDSVKNIHDKTKFRSSQSFLATLTGLVTGSLSGLLGVGGGIVMVPLFRRWLGLPMKNAVATSLICVGCFAVPGTITHAIEGGIDWRFAIWLTIGVVVGAPFGSKMALKMSDKKLQRVFGLFLAAVAVVYGGGELLAL